MDGCEGRQHRSRPVWKAAQRGRGSPRGGQHRQGDRDPEAGRRDVSRIFGREQRLRAAGGGLPEKGGQGGSHGCVEKISLVVGNRFYVLCETLRTPAGERRQGGRRESSRRRDVCSTHGSSRPWET